MMHNTYDDALMASPPAHLRSGPVLQTPSPRKRAVRPTFTDPSFMDDSSPHESLNRPWDTAPPTINARSALLASSGNTMMMHEAPLLDVMVADEETQRPDLKRRRTAPASITSHGDDDDDDRLPVSSAALRKQQLPPYFARANGNASTDVWPEDVDMAFFEGLRFVPKLGRRKVLVAGKACGRNELIAEFIRRKTGKIRSRKQVSSHIQVLKNIRKNDPDFMALVADPAEGEDVFTEAAATFFGGIAFCGPASTPAIRRAMSASAEFMPPAPSPSIIPSPLDTSPAALSAPAMSTSLSPLVASPSMLSAPGMTTSLSEGHLSPYSANMGAFTLHRSNSVSSCGSPLSSQASDISRAGSPLFAPAQSPSSGSSPRSATFSPGSATITNGMRGLAFSPMGMPTVAVSPPISASACPVLPDSMCLWADSDAGVVDRMHIFAKLEKQRNLASVEHVYFEDVRDASTRYPKLAEMHEHMPCQFLHVKVNMCIPRAEDFDETLANMHTQLNLKSTEELKLTAVTTIYSFGNELLSVEEPLASGKRTIPAHFGGPLMPEEPLESPVTPPSAGPNDRHRWMYSAPFAADFWQIFLRGSIDEAAGVPSYGKTPEDRAALETSINGLSIVQEYVVRSDESSMVEMSTSAISRGSSIGDVVLVVAWGFEAGDYIKPSTSVQLLSLKKNAGSALTVPSRVPSPLSQPYVPELHIETPARQTQSAHESSPEGPLSSPGSTVSTSSDDAQLPTPPTSATKSRPSTVQRRNKPALSLSIPTPSVELSKSALNTPNVQMVHTPTMPPPMEQPSSPTLRNRLGQIWAATSGDWNLSSPALASAFPGKAEGLEVHPPAALQALTAQAIAAGTPTLAVFPSSSSGLQAGGSPFLHPSSSFPNMFGNSSQPAIIDQGDYFSSPYTTA